MRLRALVLSGGGSKGAYQVGVLKRLAEAGHHYPIVCGVSVGALNGAYLSQWPANTPLTAYHALADLWDGVTPDTIVKKRFLGELRMVLPKWLGGTVSVFTTEPLAKMVRDNLDQGRVLSAGRNLRVGAVNANTGRYVSFDERAPDLQTAVLASSSFPMAFPPVRMDGDLWTDGGVRNISPIGAAFKLGATHIDIIATEPPKVAQPWDNRKPSGLEFGLRVTALQSAEIFETDIKLAKAYNQLAKCGLAPDGKRYAPMRIFRPHEPLGDSLSFEPEHIAEMRARGYADACAYLDGN